MRPFYNTKDRQNSASDSGACGETIQWVLKDNVIEISGEGEMIDYISPWYAYRSIIEYVNIEGSVNSIGQYAFYNCTSLRSINIPKTVTKIGDYAFYSCISLKTISIDRNVVEIGEDAFKDCSELAIICHKGSYVDFYAFSKKIKVIYK